MSHQQPAPRRRVHGPVAVMANSLLRAPRDALSTRQRKVLLWAIAALERTHELHSCEIEVARFARTAQISSGSIYAELRQSTAALRHAMVYPGGQLYDRQGKRAAEGPLPWLATTDDSRPGVLRITLHEALTRHLTNLTSHFTQVRLRPAMLLSSTYAIAFWERLELHRGLHLKDWRMSVHDLRQWLGIEPKQYSECAHLCRVLDRACAELAAKTDQSFRYSYDRYREEEFHFSAVAVSQPAAATGPKVTLNTDPLSVKHDRHALDEMAELRLRTGTPADELAKLVGHARRHSRNDFGDLDDGEILITPEFLHWVQWLVRMESGSWQINGDEPRSTPFFDWLRTGLMNWTPPWSDQTTQSNDA